MFMIFSQPEAGSTRYVVLKSKCVPGGITGMEVLSEMSTSLLEGKSVRTR
jgi:hypothetical protein